MDYRKNYTNFDNINTNYSFEQSDRTVSYHKSPYEINNQLNKTEKIEQNVEIDSVLSKYLMLCLELERMNRVNDQLKIFSYGQSKVFEQLKAKYENLRVSQTHKNGQIIQLRKQNLEWQNKCKNLEALLKHKDVDLLQIKEQIRMIKTDKQVLNTNIKTIQNKQYDYIKRLEHELQAERQKSHSTKINQQNIEMFLNQNNKRFDINQNEKLLKKTYEDRIIRLEQELRIQKNQHYLKMQQLLNTKTKIEDQQKRQLHSMISAFQQKINSLESHLSNHYEKQRQTDLMKRELENQLSKKNYELINLQQEFLRFKQENKRNKQMTYRSNTSNCQNCTYLRNQNIHVRSKLKKIQQISQQLTPRQVEKSYRYESFRSPQQDSSNSLKELLETANFLKGSNERVSKLLEMSRSQQNLRTVDSRKLYIQKH